MEEKVIVVSSGADAIRTTRILEDLESLNHANKMDPYISEVKPLKKTAKKLNKRHILNQQTG